MRRALKLAPENDEVKKLRAEVAKLLETVIALTPAASRWQNARHLTIATTRQIASPFDDSPNSTVHETSIRRSPNWIRPMISGQSGINQAKKRLSRGVPNSQPLSRNTRAKSRRQLSIHDKFHGTLRTAWLAWEAADSGTPYHFGWVVQSWL